MTIIHNTEQRNQQKLASSDVVKLQQHHQPTWQLCPGIFKINHARHTNKPKTKRYLCLAQANNNLYYAKDVMSYDSKSPTGNNSALLSVKRCLILREHTNPVSGEETRGWATSSASSTNHALLAKRSIQIFALPRALCKQIISLYKHLTLCN